MTTLHVILQVKYRAFGRDWGTREVRRWQFLVSRHRLPDEIIPGSSITAWNRNGITLIFTLDKPLSPN